MTFATGATYFLALLMLGESEALVLGSSTKTLRLAPRLASTSVAQASPKAQTLLVVGAGVLGQRVAAQYFEQGLGQVSCETLTEDNHQVILAELPFLKQWASTVPDPRGLLRTKDQGIYSRDIFMKFNPHNFDNVVFCAPPGKNENYVSEVRDALKMWNRRGRFVFTSSSAVYEDGLAAPTIETSPLKDASNNPRVAKLLNAETCVREIGGTVVRLAGLYHELRGAHMFFLKQGTSTSYGNSLVNQIHYDDAASLVVAALVHGSKGEVYVGCDGVPLSRQSIVNQAGLALGGGCEFTGGQADGGPGRVMSNDWTRSQLQWAPRFASFSACMEGLNKK